MKILYHHRVASRDGQFVHIDAIIDALTQQGHEIVVVAPSIADATEFGADGGWMSRLRQRLPKFISELLELAYCFYDFIQLCSAIRRHRPEAIYERYNLYLPSGIWAKTLFRLPLLLEVNSPLYDERMDYGGLALPALAKWSEYYTWRNADHVLPVTQVLAEYIYRAGVSSERVTVIPNGIDETLFIQQASTARRPEFAGKTVIGFVGFCREWHRLDEVIAVVANEDNPDLMLLIVGDGPVLGALKDKAQWLGIQTQVVMTGLVARDEMPGWLAQIDIALQPAVTPWCSPLKLIEYLATGKAIVAPDMDNIKELLADGENGLLFEHGNSEAMVAAVKRLLVDPEQKRQLQERAAATIGERQLTWQQNAQKIIDLLSAKASLMTGTTR